jgi:hypothetical protein
MCNFWCNSIKPTFGWLQYNKMKHHNELYFVCEYSVKMLSGMVTEFQALLDKQAEEAEAISMIEKRAHVEHSIAMEMRDIDHNNRLEASRKNPIGYNYNINKENNND